MQEAQALARSHNEELAALREALCAMDAEGLAQGSVLGLGPYDWIIPLR